MGIPEYEAKRYEGRVKDGGILLSVHSDDSQWTKKATEILERTGAQDISSTAEVSGEKSELWSPLAIARPGDRLERWLFSQVLLGCASVSSLVLRCRGAG